MTGCEQGKKSFGGSEGSTYARKLGWLVEGWLGSCDSMAVAVAVAGEIMRIRGMI